MVGGNGHKNGLEEALEAFGVNIEEPVYARMMRVEIRGGVTPVETFLTG
jgi:hypothetical protein